MYHIFLWVSVRLSRMKVGLVKMPMKHGITAIVPRMYHGILGPHLVLNLSLITPTIGVVIPSMIYPERVAAAVTSGESSTTSFRYQDK